VAAADLLADVEEGPQVVVEGEPDPDERPARPADAEREVAARVGGA
jgi:hypothetical protein